MYHFNVKIAGYVAEIESLHIRSKAICRDFITEDQGELKIILNQQDIEKEKARLESAFGECTLWDSSLEVSALHVALATSMIDYGSFVMHGAAIAYDDKAYIFSAKSGIGKTTHIIKWLKHLSCAKIINGDKPFIATYNDGKQPMACGSPWAGKENLYTNIMVPLKSIIFMERADKNQIEQITFTEAFPKFLQQVYQPDDEEKMRKTLQLMQRLGPFVTFWRFQCNNFIDDCFDVAFSALVREHK